MIPRTELHGEALAPPQTAPQDRRKAPLTELFESVVYKP